MPKLPKKTYSMDVCYKSDVGLHRQDTTKHPIAMAYGFSDDNAPDGDSITLGSIMNLRINDGDQMWFTLGDIAAQPAQVSKVEIQCDDVTNGLGNPTRNVSPFNGWVNGTYTVHDPFTPEMQGGSAGTNMMGWWKVLGPFTAQLSSGTQGKKTYEITVTVTLTNGRIFKADPEVDVMSE